MGVTSKRRLSRLRRVGVSALLVAGAIGAPSSWSSPIEADEAMPVDVGREPIVGGSEVSPVGAYPFMVGLISVQPGIDFPICGGALLSPTWVVTAAHCLKVDVSTPEVAADISVVVGRHDLLGGSEGQRIQAARLIPHPGWRDVVGDDIRNDIALIELASPATAGTPIAVAQPRDAALWAPGQEGTVMGWGARNPNGTDPSPVLLEVDVPHQPDSNCGGSDYDPALSLCAGGVSGEDSCSGDSGGPLISTSSAEPFLLVGLVSSGPNPCGSAGRPAVYTEVAAYLDWLETNSGLELTRPTAPIGGAASATMTAERLDLVGS